VTGSGAVVGVIRSFKVPPGPTLPRRQRPCVAPGGADDPAIDPALQCAGEAIMVVSGTTGLATPPPARRGMTVLLFAAIAAPAVPASEQEHICVRHHLSNGNR
jgi:hypothetical protein